MHERKPATMYNGFETASVGTSTLGSGTNPRLECTPALATESAQSQMNRWVVLALAASSSFITTLDGSIVNWL
jgi:hypothetical protein